MILAPIVPLPDSFLVLLVAMALFGRELQGRARRQSANMALHELRRPLQNLLLVDVGLSGSVGVSGATTPMGAASRAGGFMEPGAAMLNQAVDALGDLDRELNGGPAPESSVELLDLHGLVDSCARRWRSRASLADASISVRWQGPEAEVLGDHGLLAQAFDNLVVNAIEHGGPRIEISAESGESDVEVEVIDSGSESQSKGREDSPAHVIERLCGRRRHGHGLAVVERAVRQHGGLFDLRLSPQGSRADIRLPLADNCPPLA